MGKVWLKNKLYTKGTVASSGGGGSGTVESLIPGSNIVIDDTDPANPIISTTADDIIVVANYSALPAANTVSGEFYWCTSSQGTSWLPGSLGGTYYNSGMYYSNGTTWEYLATPYQATQVEVDAGTNTDKFVTPSTLTNASLWSSVLRNNTGRSGGTTFISGTAATDKLIIQTTSGNQVTGVSNLITFKSGNNGASELLRLGDGIAANIGEFSCWAAGQSSSTTHIVRAGTNFTYLNAGTDLRLTVGAVSYLNCLSGAGTFAVQKPMTFASGANVTLVAGTTTLAPLVFTSGTNKTTASAGSVEYNGQFSMTPTDATRRFVTLAASSTKVTAGAPYTNDGYITLNINGTDIKVMTTA